MTRLRDMTGADWAGVEQRAYDGAEARYQRQQDQAEARSESWRDDAADAEYHDYLAQRGEATA